MIEDFREFLEEELGIDEDITLDTSLRDDLLIDSLMATQMALSLEDKYGVRMEQQELVALKTVGDCLELLKKKGVENADR